jgi:triosephosphate isomerase
MVMRRRLVAGNWKMNGDRATADAMLAALAGRSDRVDLLLCPPATLIGSMAGRGVPIGGQDCHPEPKGAHTGDIAAEMLREAGAVAVIVGHSERRADHREDDALVCRKAAAAWRAGLLAIICIGETEAERDRGEALAVVARQLAASVPDGATAERLVIAYEPVWAIGTGRTPTATEIGEVHAAIRRQLADRFGEAEAHAVRLLYGGSVKAGNAAEIFAVADVDGALVGGASLTPDDFLPIVEAAGRA